MQYLCGYGYVYIYTYMYMYIHIYIFKNVPQEGDSGLDPPILLHLGPESVFSSLSNILLTEPSCLLCETL